MQFEMSQKHAELLSGGEKADQQWGWEPQLTFILGVRLNNGEANGAFEIDSVYRPLKAENHHCQQWVQIRWIQPVWRLV